MHGGERRISQTDPGLGSDPKLDEGFSTASVQGRNQDSSCCVRSLAVGEGAGQRATKAFPLLKFFGDKQTVQSDAHGVTSMVHQNGVYLPKSLLMPQCSHLPHFEPLA